MKFSLLSLGAASLVAAAPKHLTAPSRRDNSTGTGNVERVVGSYGKFENWATFKANGVNLGGWLLQEKAIDPIFFEDNAPDAADEDSFCEILGQEECGELLEERYKTFFQLCDIDFFASYGVNLLRVPVGYWAFMDAMPGYHYYAGNQLAWLTRLATYAQETHGMHIVLDLHGLPGGQNGLDNQGKTGELYWWNNQTNFDASVEMVRLATEYVLDQPHPEQWTISLINEPLMQGPSFFGQTSESMALLNEYYYASIDIIRGLDPAQVVPIMLSDGFSGQPAWNEWWADNTQNIVFDTHIYFFVGGSYGAYAYYDACYLAKSYAEHTQPVFLGEWSIQATVMNTGDVDIRSLFYYTQLDAYVKYLSGGAMWNGKHFGTDIVGDDGTDQSWYWGWSKMASQGVVKKPGETYTTYEC
ncbi:glycoside hydrolase superfamily [Xylariomycetidae sp. FL2044]|nr:glycoside hydrolase superfamily [Xylariomycetidae sp. FL2044]